MYTINRHYEQTLMNEKPEHLLSIMQELGHIYGLELSTALTPEQAEARLAEKINGKIRDDFGALVQLLYRIDIHEGKLRSLLQENNGEDAGKIIARMIIERLAQKIETRRQFKSTDTASGEERW